MSATFRSWESAYLAISVVLGEPLDVVVAALGAARTAHARELIDALRSPSRETRAHALAHAVSEVARAVDAVSLA
ncbi:MAG: hypothetical protein ACLP1X_21475 [Polyangiaceae bacterium]|jgi:hypothetical protein